MNATMMVQLLSVGQLSVEHWRARQAMENARHAYHQKIREFERMHGSLRTRIDPTKPEFAAVIGFTKERFDALQNAKRAANNINRRMQNACRKMARLSACSG